MGKTIRSGAREVIFNVYERCLAEDYDGKIPSDLDDLHKRIADMTGNGYATNFTSSAIFLMHCKCYKILIVSPAPGKSHSILGGGLVKHLENAGHEAINVDASGKGSALLAFRG